MYRAWCMCIPIMFGLMIFGDGEKIKYFFSGTYFQVGRKHPGCCRIMGEK